MKSLRIRKLALQASLLLPSLLDGIVLLAVTGLLSGLWFYARTGILWLTWVLTLVFCLCMGFAYYRWQAARYRSRIQRLRIRASGAYLAKTLALDAGISLRQVLAAYLQENEGWLPTDTPLLLEKDGCRRYLAALRRHPDAPVDVQALLPLHHAMQRLHVQACILLSTAPLTPAAAHAAPELGIRLLSLEALIPWIWERVPPPEPDELIVQMRRFRHVREGSALAGLWNRTQPYRRSLRLLSSALILLLLSRFTFYPLWYQLTASLCLLLAVLAFPWKRSKAA